MKLITIPFSHYCEKARWALDRCGVAYREDGHLPLFHYLAAYRVGGKGTVPILVDGATVLRDSTDIVAYADARRPGTLLPADPAERAAALTLEDDFDRQLGPATRRWAYYYLLPNREADGLLTRDVPWWQFALLRASRPLAVAAMRRGLKIDDAGLVRSTRRIDETFARVSDRLGDGRRYLVGGEFSVADLTFASLAAPILIPPEHPTDQAPIDLYPEDARGQIEAWRDSPAGRFGLRLYTEEREVRPRSGVSVSA